MGTDFFRHPSSVHKQNSNNAVRVFHRFFGESLNSSRANSASSCSVMDQCCIPSVVRPLRLRSMGLMSLIWTFWLAHLRFSLCRLASTWILTIGARPRGRLSG